MPLLLISTVLDLGVALGATATVVFMRLTGV